MEKEDWVMDIWREYAESIITEEDEIKLILLDYYYYQIPLQEIARQWERTEEEIMQIIKENPLTQDELNEIIEEMCEDYDTILKPKMDN